MKGTLVLVGHSGEVHVGAHFVSAARELGFPHVLCDVAGAFAGSAWSAKLNWRLRGHRPTRLREFGRQVIQVCREVRPAWLLSTGIAPLDAPTLRDLGAIGVKRLNFSTDDPWNRAHRAPWFLEALPLYDHIFTPRRATMDDLRGHGCGDVSYLPFAYNPDLHFREEPADERADDIVFAGGADRDRVPYMSALIQAGFNVALYGGYWRRHPATASHARGHADAGMLRQAIASARVALCLVRRANRDGHAMRTFEVAAMGACMLVEDTEEHREIFGPDGRAVVYFQTQAHMIERLRRLLDEEEERLRLREASHTLITSGENTYRDRLEAIIRWGSR